MLHSTRLFVAAILLCSTGCQPPTSPSDGNNADMLSPVQTQGLSTYSLHQNRPNPFAGSTSIKFSLATRSNTRLVVYDAEGSEVITLVDELREEGEYSIQWNAKDSAGRPVPPGLYLYRIETELWSAEKWMTCVLRVP